MSKKNYWESVEAALRTVFPYPWPETNWKGEPIDEEDLEDYYESEKDPLITFLTGEELSPSQQLGCGAQSIQFLEFEGSFYETVDYDSIPQGTEDECWSVVEICGGYYKVGLYFTSHSGYHLNEVAYKVTPKQVEITIYE